MAALRHTLLGVLLGLLSLAPLPVAAQEGACAGDCNRDEQVTVDEILALVSLALEGGPAAICRAGDTSGDGSITVDEVQRAITGALIGCPPPPAATPTPVFTEGGEPTATPDSPPPATPTGLLMNIGRISGRAGDEITVTVSLSGAGSEIVATSTDIVYDSTHLGVARLSPEDPDCDIAPRIGPGTVANKRLLPFLLSAPAGKETVRLGAVAFDNHVPVGNGPLYSCRFRIDPAAPAGVVPLTLITGASDALGRSILPAAGEARVDILP